MQATKYNHPSPAEWQLLSRMFMYSDNKNISMNYSAFFICFFGIRELFDTERTQKPIHLLCLVETDCLKPDSVIQAKSKKEYYSSKMLFLTVCREVR